MSIQGQQFNQGEENARRAKEARKHRYITTNSGVNIYSPDQFKVDEVRMSDIMDSIAKICRYNGHVRRFYSVAEHSVLVSRIAELLGDTEAMIPALFHDAHEAYCGDIPSPQKGMVQGMHEFEAGYEVVVRVALGLQDQHDDVWRRVKIYDTMILHRELIVLRDPLPCWFDPIIERAVPMEVQPVGLEWQEARAMFRQRMHELEWLPCKNL